jgi:NADH-quinone oxidoreductase subunit A
LCRFAATIGWSAAERNSLFEIYFPIVLLLLVSIAAGGGLYLVSRFVGKKTTDSKAMDTPYECGVEPEGGTKERFPVKFYLVAILFIVFDIEVVFMYPWAVVYDRLALFGFIEMLVFIGILIIGYIYVLRRGALKWD